MKFSKSILISIYLISAISFFMSSIGVLTAITAYEFSQEKPVAHLRICSTHEPATCIDVNWKLAVLFSIITFAIGIGLLQFSKKLRKQEQKNGNS